MIQVARQIVYVPREGFSVGVARRLLSLSEERFRALQRDLVYGEWIMWRHVEHITLAGMRKLAADAGVDLEFRRAVAVRPPKRCFIERSLPAGDRE